MSIQCRPNMHEMTFFIMSITVSTLQQMTHMFLVQLKSRGFRKQSWHPQHKEITFIQNLGLQPEMGGGESNHYFLGILEVKDPYVWTWGNTIETIFFLINSLVYIIKIHIDD